MLQHSGLLGLFIGSFLASTVLPFPSEALLVANIALGNDVWLCVLLASVGNTLGGMTSFWLGRLGKWQWLEKWFKVKKEKIVAVQQKVNRFKSVAAFFSWLPVVGDLIAIALGFMKISPWKSCLYMAIGRFARFCVVGGIINLF